MLTQAYYHCLYSKSYSGISSSYVYLPCTPHNLCSQTTFSSLYINFHLLNNSYNLQILLTLPLHTLLFLYTFFFLYYTLFFFLCSHRIELSMSSCSAEDTKLPIQIHFSSENYKFLHDLFQQAHLSLCLLIFYLSLLAVPVTILWIFTCVKPNLYIFSMSV